MSVADAVARMYAMQARDPSRIWWVQFDDEGEPRIMSKSKSDIRRSGGFGRLNRDGGEWLDTPAPLSRPPTAVDAAVRATCLQQRNRQMTDNHMAPISSERKGGEVMPYQFDGRNVRILEKDGEYWFVAGDVAAEIGHRDAANLTRILDRDEKGTHILSTPSGEQEMSIISEPGLYRAIIQRRATKRMDDRLRARIGRFQRWVFHDVMPSIRKTGSYSVAQPEPQFSIPQTYAEALRLAAEQSELIETQKTAITEMKPKADFHDHVADAANAQTFMDVAKALKTGRTRLTRWLRDRKLVMENNRPYQSYMEAGYFRVVEKTRKDRDTGEIFTYVQTLVTGKGLSYLQKKWSEDHPGLGI